MLFFEDDPELYGYLQRRNAAAVFLFLVLPAPGQLRAPRRCRHTAVNLRRADLMPDPRIDSAWFALYRNQDDRAVITTMGVDTSTFEFLLESGFREAWDTTPITRNDVNPAGCARLGARSLDAAGGLGLLLNHLCSTMSETALEQIFAVVPAVLSRYIKFAMHLLLDELRILPASRIEWPTVPQMEVYATAVNRRHPLVQGGFGFLDGLNLPVGVSGDPEIENVHYNGWLHAHKVSNVIAFAPDGQ